ncbi:PREDICTED: uncharacterized protein LOC105117854 [Populus euphratica]|uniref:RING-type E3 ubiquitin transferase n=1 Tax=Populus euphratica TaxID=75702 RepID=A0AAJ6TNF0_POPEU|nr:PREDICTED: uncharacterized protein LOC105117853 [Populus euphratica]XP_011013931.1 PREDICTED: uncharacterized protein LOC105117854 [Populus euphratica]
MDTHIDYDFIVRLKPKTNRNSQHVNCDQPLQKVPATFPVNFLLYKRPIYYSLHGVAFSATDRRPESISRKIIHIPVGDSLCHHINDFKGILTDIGIPGIKISQILIEIATKAHGIDTCNGVLMLVAIRKTVYHEARLRNEEDDIGRAERESMEVEAKPIPATKSSIDALERVVLDASASARDCTVCMEDIDAGSEAIRMPCSHVYHSDCIVKWLQTSHMCPLCRYHMPCEYL